MRGGKLNMAQVEGEIKIDIQPVGYVHDPEGAATDKSGRGISQVVIKPELAECLDGIEEYSHVKVIYWLHKIRAEERHMYKQRPHKHRAEFPEVGVFALRCPGRPNPIGLTTAEVVRRKDNVLWLRGLDALDGSPVLDIKPYSLRNDHVENPRIAEYASKLWDKVHQEGRD